VRELSIGDAVHTLECALTGEVFTPAAVQSAATQTATPPSAITTSSTPSAPALAQQADAGAASSAAPAKDSESDTQSRRRRSNTIRVEVSRLEALMNLVGELVLQKNRVFALSRKLTSSAAHAAQVEGKPASGEADITEAMSMAAGSLDRVTSDIQVAVMRTRMQPVDKLFGRYPRLIRDLANKTGKKINLVIEGGDTEVDKSVIEELGDPLIHMLRNSCDHGL
jgi:two-component system, chemotaxis family, sensor kinase CheA